MILTKAELAPPTQNHFPPEIRPENAHVFRILAPVPSEERFSPTGEKIDEAAPRTNRGAASVYPLDEWNFYIREVFVRCVCEDIG